MSLEIVLEPSCDSGSLIPRVRVVRVTVMLGVKEENIMSELIAYCGLDCSKCNAFKATQANDLERKKELAKKWTEGLNVEFQPEEITCNGCLSDTLSGWCSKICKIRPCAVERKVKTCAHCEEYPCGKLKEFLANEPEATKSLERIRQTL